MPMANPSDPESILNSIKMEVWVYVALNSIGRSLSEAPLIVERQKTVNAKPSWVPLESGPLVDLVRMPNERESFDVLVWRLVMSLCTGDGYLVIDKASNRLYHVHASKVGIVGKEDGLEGYEVGVGPEKKTFKWNEMVHIAMPNPLHEFHGLSPVEPIKNQVLINHYYTKYLKNFFKNGAVPFGALSTDQVVDDDIASRSRNRWNESHKGEENWHNIAILGNGLAYQDVSPSIDKLVVDTLWKMPREAILAVFGLPPVMAGIYEYANYANSQEQVKIFWQNAVLPMQRLIVGALNIQYVPRFGSNIRLRFDTSNVKALQEDDTIKATRLTKYVSGGIMTPNEAREDIGLEPLEGGDELRATPVGGFGQQEDQGGGESGKKLVTPSPERTLAVQPNSPRLKLWHLHEKAVLRHERSFAKIMRGYFDDQLDRIISRIDRVTIGGRLSMTLLLSQLAKKDDVPTDDPDAIFNLGAEGLALREATQPFIKESVKKAGQKAIDKIGVDLLFNVNNPRVDILIDQFQNRLSKVNNTTYNNIKEIIRQAYDEGWSTAQLEQEIRDLYSNFSKVRSTRIAMTEMNGVVNGGSFEGYREAGVENKEWMTAPGANYPRHEEYDGLDGQIVPVDQPFVVGGALMMYPGDPDGPPEEVINCHCTFAAVV